MPLSESMAPATDTSDITTEVGTDDQFDPQLEEALESLTVVAHQPTTIHDGEFVRNPSATLLEQKDCRERIVAAGYDINAAIRALFAQFEAEREAYVADNRETD